MKIVYAALGITTISALLFVWALYSLFGSQERPQPVYTTRFIDNTGTTTRNTGQQVAYLPAENVNLTAQGSGQYSVSLSRDEAGGELSYSETLATNPAQVSTMLTNQSRQLIAAQQERVAANTTNPVYQMPQPTYSQSSNTNQLPNLNQTVPANTVSRSDMRYSTTIGNYVYAIVDTTNMRC
jgi:hypothetical protein